MNKQIFLMVILTLCGNLAQARLGETKEECQKRYGRSVVGYVTFTSTKILQDVIQPPMPIKKGISSVRSSVHQQNENTNRLANCRWSLKGGDIYAVWIVFIGGKAEWIYYEGHQLVTPEKIRQILSLNKQGYEWSKIPDKIIPTHNFTNYEAIKSPSITRSDGGGADTLGDWGVFLYTAKFKAFAEKAKADAEVMEGQQQINQEEINRQNNLKKKKPLQEQL